MDPVQRRVPELCIHSGKPSPPKRRLKKYNQPEFNYMCSGWADASTRTLSVGPTEEFLRFIRRAKAKGEDARRSFSGLAGSAHAGRIVAATQELVRNYHPLVSKL